MSSEEDIFNDGGLNANPTPTDVLPVQANDSDIGDLSDLSLPSDFELEACTVNAEGNEQHESSPEVSSEDEESLVQHRRGRKRFKKGVLYRRKGSRSESRSESEGRQSEDYMRELDSILDSNPSDTGVNLSSDGTNTDTVPSETVEDEDVNLDEGNQPSNKPSKKRKKRKTPLKSTKSAKYLQSVKPKEEDTLELDDASNMHDVKCSVQDLLREKLDSALPNDTHLSTVAEYLKLTLSDDWTVSLSPDMLTLSTLCNMANPIVERAITWRDNKINFLVLNQQLNPRKNLWNLAAALPDPENCGDVADFLTSSSKMFLYFEICAGVISHRHLWEKFSEAGVVCPNMKPPSIRSTSCSHLLVYPGTCSYCRDLERKMSEHDRQKRRTASRETRDQSKVNTKYLKQEEMREKIKKIQEEKRIAKQTIKRLRKRVDPLIQRNAERVNSDLSSDFVEIMNLNVDKMTQLENIFREQQSLALSKRGGKERSMRWHPVMIRLALHLRSLSPAAYEFLNGCGVISLPSSRRLYDFSQFTEVQEGTQEDLLKILHKHIEENCILDHQKYFNLILDEMSIRSELVYDARSGELVGYTNLTSMESELASLEAEIQGKNYEKKLAKKVLVFMLTGCTNDYKFVPAFFSTDDVSAAQLNTRVWDVIYAVEEVGAKVLVVIFDGASVNRKFIRLHFSMGDKDFTYCTVNSTSGEQRLIYFMLDTPHLLKTFRNCFANSFAHRNSRSLEKDGQKISWKAMEALFGLCEKFKITKLTKSHVYLSSFSCMKVILAAQVFSDSVANALEKFKDVSPLKEQYSEELVKFIRLMNKAFDCLNGGVHSKKKDVNPNLREYVSPDDSRFDFLVKEFLGYLEDWETYVSTRAGNYSKEQRSKMTISYQSLEAMKITVHSFTAVARFLLEKGAPSISSRYLNQDPLEQYFSEMRRRRGSDNNPNLKQVGHTRLSLQATQGMSSLGKKGNTQTEGQKVFVDESPLPVRKKLRRDD